MSIKRATTFTERHLTLTTLFALLALFAAAGIICLAVLTSPAASATSNAESTPQYRSIGPPQALVTGVRQIVRPA